MMSDFLSRWLARGWLLPAVLAAVAGCGGPSDRLLPVAGQVTVKGEPLTDGKLVFHPDPEKGNTSTKEPRGIVQEGVYRLTTDGRDGAPPGWYRVAVFAFKEPTPETGLRAPEWLANQRYSDTKTSGLSIQVGENSKLGAYDLDLEP